PQSLNEHLPVAQSLSGSPPVAQSLREHSPVAESLSESPPMAESLSGSYPMAESLSGSPPVGKTVSGYPPMAKTVSGNPAMAQSLSGNAGSSVRIDVRDVKIVTIGDATVGKTCMLITYSTNQFPDFYKVTVFDSYAVSVAIGDREFQLNLYDTAGQEEYKALSAISYNGAHIFLVCFSVFPLRMPGQIGCLKFCFNVQMFPSYWFQVSPVSIENVRANWVPQIQLQCPDVPFLLVGTQIDLRRDAETLEKLADRNQRPFTPEQGERFAEELGAAKYVECSSLTQVFCATGISVGKLTNEVLKRNRKENDKNQNCFCEGLKNVFDEALMVALKPPKKSTGWKKKKPLEYLPFLFNACGKGLRRVLRSLNPNRDPEEERARAPCWPSERLPRHTTTKSGVGLAVAQKKSEWTRTPERPQPKEVSIQGNQTDDPKACQERGEALRANKRRN
ncbi:unnamed protein product, partial [Cyprideis torosa]